MPIRNGSDAIKMQSMRSGELQIPENIFSERRLRCHAFYADGFSNGLAAPIRILIALRWGESVCMIAGTQAYFRQRFTVTEEK
jgi:hypothetical protein